MASLLKFGIKSAIVGGTVYFTIDQGLWKKSDETTLLYGKMYQTISPLIKGVTKDVDIQIPEIPKAEDMWYSVQNGYNKGVIMTVGFISTLPSKITGWTKTGMEMAMKQVKQSQDDTSKTIEK